MKKRFTMDTGNWQTNIYDDGEVLDAREIVDLLNQLCEENKLRHLTIDKLKKDIIELKNEKDIGDSKDDNKERLIFSLETIINTIKSDEWKLDSYSVTTKNEIDEKFERIDGESIVVNIDLKSKVYRL